MVALPHCVSICGCMCDRPFLDEQFHMRAHIVRAPQSSGQRLWHHIDTNHPENGEKVAAGTVAELRITVNVWA